MRVFGGVLLLKSHKKQDTGFVEARWASGPAPDEYCFTRFLPQALHGGGDPGMGQGGLRLPCPVPPGSVGGL